MSIKPQFAHAILSGAKGVEFRKRRLAPDISTVVIYATLPVGLVLGTFVVGGYDEGRPAALWERHRHHAGISRRAYGQYYRGVGRAVGILVEHPTALEQPVLLSEILFDLRAPQSFAYLDMGDLAGVLHQDEEMASSGTFKEDLAASVS